MIGHTRLNKPKLGDVFVRTTVDGAREDAAISSLLTWPNGDWRAMLTTEAGWDHVTPAKELRGEHEWRPADWQLDETTQVYRPPGLRWDKDAAGYIAVVGEKPREGARPAPNTSGPRPPSPSA